MVALSHRGKVFPLFIPPEKGQKKMMEAGQMEMSIDLHMGTCLWSEKAGFSRNTDCMDQSKRWCQHMKLVYNSSN